MSKTKETPKPTDVAGRIDGLVMVTPIFGHKALRAWIEFDGEKYIGMGSVATYDRDGKLLDFKIEPTGLLLRLA